MTLDFSQPPAARPSDNSIDDLWPLVPANVLCGLVILTVIIVWMHSGIFPAAAVLPFLGLPLDGLARMADRLAGP